ncbi:hypothetical protein B0H16DRAFT_251461 [Mycena metata]|uniref:Uncharacterized protein n=1 Tax=Mycena metata TaxID=1033252 RepID=A0AAD7HUG0_9AGAR|nr:hypothetical protein B0H16DRAFT_251461 [Mycena metata]
MSCPPQIHKLTNAERSRLVRSNRKLQALLGETPQVIASARAAHARIPSEPITPTTPMNPQSSSFVSSAGTRTPSTRRRPQLLLHLQPPNHKYTFSLPSPTTPGTPLSPTSSITLNMLQTPTTTPPLSRAPSTKDLRRRHLAKLTRTLGENIAPELVLEPRARPTLQRATTLSHGSFTSASSSERLSVRTPAVVDDGYVVVAAMSPSPSPRPSSSRGSSTLGRSFSAAARTTGMVDRPPVRRRRSLVGVTQTLPSEGTRAGPAPTPPTSNREDELKTGRRKKEKGWSGEWNREMQAVAQKLRALK